MIRFGQILTDDLLFRKTEAVAIKTRLSHWVPRVEKWGQTYFLRSLISKKFPQNLTTEAPKRAVPSVLTTFFRSDFVRFCENKSKRFGHGKSPVTDFVQQPGYEMEAYSSEKTKTPGRMSFLLGVSYEYKTGLEWSDSVKFWQTIRNLENPKL